MNENQSLLTVKQVAEKLHISESKVYKHAQSGELPSYKLGGSVRFKEEDVDGWVEAQKRQPENIEDRARQILSRVKPVDVENIIRREIDSVTRS